MIYIVEIPHQSSPTVWTAANEAELVNVLEDKHNNSRSDYTVWAQSTPRAFIENMGCSTLDELNEAYPGFDDVIAVVNDHGMDAAMYWNREREIWQKREIPKLEAYLDDLESELHLLKIYKTEDEAQAAVANSERWTHHQGQEAWQALKELLTPVAVGQ